MSNPSRVQTGVPTGGQFATQSHAEPPVALTVEPAGESAVDAQVREAQQEHATRMQQRHAAADSLLAEHDMPAVGRKVQVSDHPYLGNCVLTIEDAHVDTDGRLMVGVRVPDGIPFAVPADELTQVASAARTDPDGKTWQAPGTGAFTREQDGVQLHVGAPNTNGQHLYRARSVDGSVTNSGYSHTLDEAFDSANWAGAAVRSSKTRVAHGAPTPWGRADHVEEQIPGIASVTTSSHGGYKLSPKRNKAIHPAWRRRSGWYEEDCEWAIVAHTFADDPLFRRRADILREMDSQATAEGITHAERVTRQYWPNAYEKVTGKQVLPGQSCQRDSDVFQAKHSNDQVSISAIGSDADSDPVILTTTTGGTRDLGTISRRFAVPRDVYREEVGPDGMFVDPQRFPEITDTPS